MDFGASSPKTMCSIVKTAKATGSAMLCAIASLIGRPSRCIAPSMILRHHIFSNPAKSKAGKCNSQLSSSEVSVKVVDYFFSCSFRIISFFKSDLRRPDLYNCKFGRDEKSIEKNQKYGYNNIDRHSSLPAQK